MRFDDSLDTVLAADRSSPGAAVWTWRQLVDLIGRRRAPARPDAIARLHAIRDLVPADVRLATARGLERADPPAALVALFVDEPLVVAGPVMRSAQLTAQEWLDLLPRMRPATRGVLRLRRDLPDQVVAVLAAFGPSDFALGGTAAEEAAPAADPGSAAFVAPEPDPFVAVADVVRDLPAVAQAMRQEAPVASRPAADDNFEIAELVARIEAHQRTLGTPPVAAQPVAPPDRFRFETDGAGLIRWVDGIERSPLIGLSLTAGRDGQPVSVDGVAAGALAQRVRFTDARLEVGGRSDATGSWRISATPVFEPATGRFTGYRGVARRPRPDEAPGAATATPNAPATDMLRQLVHELRTPTNAISGFAEMIERELLGPVIPAYREQAATIRSQTIGLLDAIDDLDTAARLESQRLDLRPETVPLQPLLVRIRQNLDPLLQVRGAILSLDVAPDAVAIGDAAALDRLLSRFLAALIASAGAGETISGGLTRDRGFIALIVSRPAAFVAPSGALFEADAEAEAEASIAGGPLLGTGFAFRLARRLAGELGGSLTVGPAVLTLRLPAAVKQGTVVGPAGLEPATKPL